MNERIIEFIIYVAVVLIIASVQLLYPSVSQRNITLGVTLPSEAYEMEEFQRIIKRFRRRTVFYALLAIIFIAVLYFLEMPTSLASSLFIFGILIMMIAVIQGRRELLLWKKDRNFTTGKQVHVVETGLSSRKFSEKTLWLYVIPLLIIVAMTILLATQYSSLPEEIPTHWGFDGKPDQFSRRSIGSVFIVQILSFFLWVVIFGGNLIHLKVKQRIDPASPADSLRNLYIARKAWTLFYWVFALGFVGTTSVFSALMTLGKIKSGNVLAITMIVEALLMVTGIFVLWLKIGNTGERLPVREQKDTVLPSDEDEHWYLGGTIYYNPNDPSIFVAKRIGMGTTMNAGSTVGKVVYGVLILAILLGIALPFVLV